MDIVVCELSLCVLGGVGWRCGLCGVDCLSQRGDCGREFGGWLKPAHSILHQHPLLHYIPALFDGLLFIKLIHPHYIKLIHVRPINKQFMELPIEWMLHIYPLCRNVLLLTHLIILLPPRQPDLPLLLCYRPLIINKVQVIVWDCLLAMQIPREWYKRNLQPTRLPDIVTNQIHYKDSIAVDIDNNVL